MIYDCFCFYNELDLLEIRFNILDKSVDKFVLCESTETFSGKAKPLFYQMNMGRFAKWNHKIIHVVAPTLETDSAFERAGFQKDYLKTGLKDCTDEDIIYFGDLDEIWKPQYIFDDKVYNLKQLNYCYYLNNRSSEEWIGTIVTKYKNVKDGSFNIMRAKHDHILDVGGWHFTNMGGSEQIKKKLDAYDHQEYNNDFVKEQIEQRMADGEDYVGRNYDWQGKLFTFGVDESQLPMYLIDNKEKYAHLFK